jgi:hypothetical protein
MISKDRKRPNDELSSRLSGRSHREVAEHSAAWSSSAEGEGEIVWRQIRSASLGKTRSAQRSCDGYRSNDRPVEVAKRCSPDRDVRSGWPGYRFRRPLVLERKTGRDHRSAHRFSYGTDRCRDRRRCLHRDWSSRNAGAGRGRLPRLGLQE